MSNQPHEGGAATGFRSAGGSAAPTDLPLGRSPVMTRNGILATAHPLATAAGARVLQAGGNAADAAIATALALGVVQPMMCGLGGDVFGLYYEAKQRRVHAVLGSGVAPAAADPAEYRRRGYRSMPLYGPLAVAVPGAVHAYELIHRRFGTMPWAELFTEAIRLAEDGFPVPPITAHYFHEAEQRLREHNATPYLPDGRVPRFGQIWRQPELAATLRSLAEGGSDLFYRGDLGRHIADHLAALGGLFDPGDLAHHQSEIVDPLRVTYRGTDVYQVPPPSQGLVHLEALNIVEGFDLPAAIGGQVQNPRQGWAGSSAAAIHQMSEAIRLAFGDRIRYAGDPAFVRFPLRGMLSKEYAVRQRARIQASGRVPRAELPSDPWPFDGDTTYFCVVDREGNAFSFIQSLSHSFGSAVVVPGTGILLNNRAGRGFSLDEGHPNLLQPGKKTMHTLNCWLLARGERLLAVGGTPGGDGQPQWNLQLVTALLDGGLHPQQAVEAPRWTVFPGTDPANQAHSEELRLEGRFPPEVAAGLARLGHPVAVQGPWAGGGGAQVIWIDPESDARSAGSDPRVDGCAMAAG